MDVRVNLRNVIKDKGYIQASVANRAGMSPCQLSQVVNLERRFDANEMFAICDAIEMTPVELAAYEPRGRTATNMSKKLRRCEGMMDEKEKA